MAEASFPLTIDPDIGTNDFRISDAGGTGESIADAMDPSVTYNSTNNEYLVVWEADDTDETGVVDSEFEIFGQRLTSAGVEILPNDFRISDAGDTGSALANALNPTVTYNSTDNEYLVVWQADDTDETGVVDDEFEIFGQRLTNLGVEILPNDFRISDAGGTGSFLAQTLEPTVTYNSTNNEYLVVWEADDTDGGVVNGETEIFGQLLSNVGGELGLNDFRISDAGGTGDALLGAFSPAVTYNSTNNEYLVVWDADDTDAGLTNGEFEIFGQRLSNTGFELGTNDFRISDAGGSNDIRFDANNPSVTYNSTSKEYLVVWHADDTDETGVVNNEKEIFGQLLTNTGAETGTNDFRISDAGGDGNANIDAIMPTVTYNPIDNEYLVVWEADDTDETGVLDDEFEIFGQRLTNTGAETGTNDFLISDAGGIGESIADAFNPSVTYNPTSNEYLVVWYADDTDAGVLDGEFEIFGQRYSSVPLPVELTFFKGQANSSGTFLTWQTASESNNEGFQIEWSTNTQQSAMGSLQWENIGFVKGEGTSYDLRNYQFLHERPAAGMNYYRLKQIDFDGKFEYSDILSVNVRVRDGQSFFQIFPNPIQKGTFTLSFSDSDFETGELSIFDSVGRLVLSQTISETQTEIQMDDLPKGVYLVVVEARGRRVLERVVVQ